MMREGDVCVALLRSKLSALLERNRSLEEENKQLRQEVRHLKGQISLRDGQDADKRSMLWKKMQLHNSKEKQSMHDEGAKEEAPDLSNASCYRKEFSRTPMTKARAPRVATPPPNPTCIRPASSTAKEGYLSPPPPPPLPLKLQNSSKTVQRVPEVVELYRLLTRKEGKTDAKAGSAAIPVATNTREMIGEIENRSAYVLAIKSDVENQGEFINFLAREVEDAAYKEMADVEEFVKWLDGELSYLVDERAVLRHFPHWPEKKADAMREAAFSYRDLKNLESEASSFRDDRRVATSPALKRMQVLQDKIEQSIRNTERVRDSTSRKYRDFKIPWEWMLDTGIISQLKMGSLKLAKEYMNRIVDALRSDPFANDEELLLQGVRFAFRIHQLAGGFDEGCRKAFQELKALASKSE